MEVRQSSALSRRVDKSTNETTTSLWKWPVAQSSQKGGLVSHCEVSQVQTLAYSSLAAGVPHVQQQT